MKIYFFFLFFLLIIISNDAICNDRQLGIKVGIVQSDMLMKDNDGTFSQSNPNSGFLVGVTGSFISSKVFTFEIGCIFSKKGLKYNYDVINYDYYYNRRDTTRYDGYLYILYGIIPVNVKVGVPIGDFKIYGILGGYLASAYYGHDNGTKTNGKNIDIVNNDIDFDYQYNFDKIDYGLNFGVGVEAYNFIIEFAYEYGLYNFSRNTNNGFTMNNRSFSLSIGYNFEI